MGAYEALSPLLRALPEIPKPRRGVSFREKLVWTSIVLILYLIMAQVPLYGIPWRAETYQPLFFLQIVMASRRGTLVELGISPIVTSGLIWQILVGSKVVNIDVSTPKGRALFTGLQKFLAIVFTFGEAAAYVLGGMYGPLSAEIAVIVFLQLVSATLLLMLMDEMLQKGWGIGSGISLFIAAGVAQQIFWQLLSPIGPLSDGLYAGVIPSVFYAVMNATATGDWSIFYKAMYRPTGFPDLVGLVTTLLLFIALVYLENMRIEIPVALSRYGGLRAKVPFKFLYVSNVPIILVSALYTNILVFSRIAWSRLNPDNSNPWLNIIAKYNVTKNDNLVPLPGSLVYYLNPPRSLQAALTDPLQAVIYAVSFVFLSVLLSMAWVETAGMDPMSQAKQLVQAEMQVPGFRRSPRIIAALLKRYIPVLTIVSGLIVAVIAVISNLLGVLGTGIGLLLLVDIIIQYQALITRERAIEMYPMLGRLLGET